MNECNTNQCERFTGCASLAAIGVALNHLHLFDPIRRLVQIQQKTIKYTPVDKLYDAFISLLAGAHGLVEINTRLRTDPALQQAFGRMACAEQSVVQETLSACTADNVSQLQQALDEIFRRQSRSAHHDFTERLLLLDVDMSGMPCGPKAAFATKGYFAHQYHRRGRQVGRVLATQYEEVVTDRLFAGNVQLVTALQPLVEAAEQTLQLDQARRARTLLRLDSGGGTVTDLNWLLARGYEILSKEYSCQRARRLAKTVTHWVQDPECAERSFGWVNEPAADYVRPLKRIAVRCLKQDQTFAYAVLLCSLSAQQVFTLLGRPLVALSDQAVVLQAYVTLYDQRGGGIETSFKGDKAGLGLTKRKKKRFEAQQMLLLLGSLAHNVVVWARQWLNCHQLQHYGPLRMVRDVFHVSGMLRFDASGSVVQIILNQQARLAHAFLCPLQGLLAPLHIVVILGEI